MTENIVEFEIQGFVPPYDKLRIRKGEISSCGTARLGMVVEVYSYGGWGGGVIDRKELVTIRDAINEHLEAIERMPKERREFAETR